MIAGTRDPFGFHKLVYHPRSGMVAHSIAEVLRDSGQPVGQPDAAAIRGYLSGLRLPDRTVLRDVLAVPPGYALMRSQAGFDVQESRVPAAGPKDLEAALRASLAHALNSGKRVALALSGGLDSALLLALLQSMGAQVPVYILATGMPDYCEREAATSLARRMQAEVRVVQADEADFVAALPRAVRAVEEPMFNLHPVAKLLLADAMAADGVQLAISGDGADQVLRRDRSANYLPLCKALFDAASVELFPAFLFADVVGHLTALPPDADKQCLRALGERIGLPARLVQGPKRSRLAPAMDLGPLLDPLRIQALATELRLPEPTLSNDKESVLWTTLCLTLDHLTTTRPAS